METDSRVTRLYIYIFGEPYIAPLSATLYEVVAISDASNT